MKGSADMLIADGLSTLGSEVQEMKDLISEK